MQSAKSLSHNKSVSKLSVASKLCLACDKEITGGRSDKKFCDDYCRGVYNNILKSPANNNIRNINNTLSKNRRILESLMPSDKINVKVSKDVLITQQFAFDYHTQSRPAKNGTYFYCYDYGYLTLDNDFVLIVRKD